MTKATDQPVARLWLGELCDLEAEAFAATAEAAERAELLGVERRRSGSPGLARVVRRGRPAERPAGPVELWRGSVPERRSDWSWTTRRTVAGGYATGTGVHRPTTGCLYRTIASPSALLAHDTTEARTSTYSTRAG
ncbi:hypothetical protein [Streptomyces sp. Inha503]|uniref:hypothetical protein n=1 Tax=Streptomyces sp. Inha503 TaxID=3383314 RepID=UPI0039A14E7D